MKSVLRILMLVLVWAPAVVDASDPILNMEDVPISLKADGTSFTDQEVRAAIIEGCMAKGWLPIVDNEGAIRATILVRQTHFAEVEITYTPSTYSITYVSSKNLNYSEGQQLIHRNYNKWIVNLSASIGKVLSRNLYNTTPAPDAVTDRDRSDVYSKILMLDDMRNRGILTDEEFDAEKTKLLNGN